MTSVYKMFLITHMWWIFALYSLLAVCAAGLLPQYWIFIAILYFVSTPGLVHFFERSRQDAVREAIELDYFAVYNRLKEEMDNMRLDSSKEGESDGSDEAI